jgi:pectin methylesterase-like acyl-CoA thioesterase
VDDGTFTDGAGAYFAGITATNIWEFTTKVGGPAIATNLVAAADGSGDFITIQGAVNSVPSGNTKPTVINIHNGTYTEIVNINSRNNLDLRGQSRSGVTIGYPNNNNLNPGAPQRSSFIINGNDCTLETLMLTNMTPNGGGQAEAVDVEGTRAIFYNMELDSYQDTFLVHSAGKLVFFNDCLIQGQTDFNWGYGTVYYTNCEIRCLGSGGHVTQPRSPYTTNGFGFFNCRITRGYSGTGTFDLGRTIGTPTSPSEALFAGCLMAGTVTGYSSDAGTNMSDYSCSNLTATAPVTLAFSTHLSSNNPFVIAIQNASSWLYGWQPQVAPNIISQPTNQSVNHGQPIMLAVGATGVPSPTYQWKLNGVNISGATNAALTFASGSVTNSGTYSVIVSNASGTMTSSNATVTVANTAPAFTPVSDQTINAGVILNITNIVIDPDVPPQTLTFGLLANPLNSTLNAAGVFNWRPSVSQAGTTNPVSVEVTDNGTPNLSATNNFNVIVNPVSKPSLGTILYNGTQLSVTVNGGTVGPDYVVEISTNLTGWQPLLTSNSPPQPFTFTDTTTSTAPARFYRVRLSP